MQPPPDRRARRLALGAAALWLVVAATGSWLVWQVVSRAGEEVAADTGAPVAPVAPTTPRATSPSTERPSARPGRPDAAQRTWSGTAGAVTVACDGARIRLIRAVPSADGYAVDLEESGPDEVRLHFEGREDRDGEETEVRAACERGAPRFEVGVEE